MIKTKKKLPPGVHISNSKKKENRYYFVVRVGSKLKCKRGFATAEEAYLALLEFKREPTFNKNVTLKEVANAFLTNFRKSHVSETADAYVGLLKNYVYPYLDPEMNYIKITDGYINYWRDEVDKLKCINVVNKNRLITLFKYLYNFAYTYYEIDNRSLLRINKFVDSDLKPFFDIESVKKFITPEDLRKLIFVANDYFKLMFLVAYCCGLRIGEIRGITIDCILDNKLSIVKQGAKNVHKDKVKKLKTRNSKRICILPDFLVTKLNEHIKANKLKQDDFLFFSPNDKKVPCSAHYINYHLASYVKDASLDNNIHFHLFRHSAATYLDQEGFKATAIKNYLGHESEETTKKFYIHSTEEDLQAISDVFSKIIKQ